MKVKQILVLARLIILQNTQVVFALFYLILFLLYHDGRIKHVIFLQVHEHVDQNLVGVVDYRHNESGDPDNYSILERPKPIMAIKVAFKLEFPLVIIVIFTRFTFLLLIIYGFGQLVSFNILLDESSQNGRAVDLAYHDIVVSQILEPR